MPPGLSAGTMIVRRFVAMTTAPPLANPPSTSLAGCVVSADRKTSAGAPCSICVASVDDESVDNVSVVPGVTAS